MKVEAAKIIDWMEYHDDETDYRERIETLMKDQLPKHGDVDNVSDAEHLRQTTGGATLETAARYVGFVLAVEYVQGLGFSDLRAAGSKKKGGK